ncbi:MAG: UvrD-helicase domain-containing protein [Acidobacteria bacterium]|nr:UvrD-helicase domain-containing protein [Acidobacteriota bacterium]
MRAAAGIQIDDEAARRRIRTSLEESLIVEASAGTGKTSELVHRIVAMLANGLTRIHRVVAVTFTRKAAGELKLRLRQELDRARSAASKPAETANLEDALERLEEARVGTIHSFCAEILRERPVEAVIDPAFQELSDYEARRIYGQAFRNWIQQKLGESAPGLRRCLVRLAHMDSWDSRSPLEKLEDAGWKLIEWRDFPTPWRREPFEREREIDALSGPTLALAALAAKCRNPNDQLLRAIRPARDLATWMERAERGAPRDYDALEGLLLQLLRDLNRDRKKKGSGTFGPGVSREEVIAARDGLLRSLESFRRRADADLGALLRAEMWDLVVRYDDLKRRAGGLDFVDLLVRVRNLIRQNAEVRRYLQAQFTHIFVDEFQDTDPLQAEILVLLAANDPEETNWLAVTPVPGKLFVVGDPKQSIYRFRRADVILYQAVRNALTARGAGLVHLTKSFRALHPIQDFVNAAFEPEVQENPFTGQPRYVPLEHHWKAKGDRPCVIALSVPRPYGFRGITKTAVNECLPGTVAGFIEWLLQESNWKVRDPEDQQREAPVAARHVCILFRHFLSGATDTTREYLHALEGRGIPHVLVGAKSFHQREEVETLRTALAAVEWPDDELSVFATLRGSLFAVSDSVLLRFRHEIGSLHPFRPLPEAPEEDFHPVAGALCFLRELHRKRNYRPIVETLTELLEATRSHAGFALRPAGNQVLANVYRVCDLARSFELGGGISFRSFVDELAAQAGKVSSTEAPALEEGAEGVRVMTVHTAKGLEFPVVILADITTRLSRSDPDLYVDTQSGLCATALLGCSPWELLDQQQEEAARDQAEGVRVAYVAATRARDLLVVPAIGDEPIAGCWLDPLNKALYPPRDRRRRSSPAPGCPPFGETTVLGAPPHDDGTYDFAIRPGLHDHQQGSYSVVWWDPAKLNLQVETNLGLRLETVLSGDGDGGAAEQGMRSYEEWKLRRDRAIEKGTCLQFDLFTATEAVELPVGFQAAIRVDALPRPPARPVGRRFGTLVHTILRDADLAGDKQNVATLARRHGRVIGSPKAEVEAAAEAAFAALGHPLVRRARAAGRCHRELPVLLRLDGGRLFEGIIDLTFLENGGWTIVDFKSDADLPARRAGYERQLQWYVLAMSQITGLPAQGWLLSV